MKTDHHAVDTGAPEAPAKAAPEQPAGAAAQATTGPASGTPGPTDDAAATSADGTGPATPEESEAAAPAPAAGSAERPDEPGKPTAKAEDAADHEDTAQAGEPAGTESETPPATSPAATTAESDKATGTSARPGGGAATEAGTVEDRSPTGGRHAMPEDGSVGAMPPPSTVPPAPAQGGGWWPPRGGQAKALIAVALVLVVAAAGGGYWWFTQRLPEDVAFRVDRVDVTVPQLDEQVATYGALYGVMAPPPEQPERLDKFRRDVAKSTAMAMVIDDAAAERKIAIPDNQVSDYLNKYVVQYFGPGQPGRDTFLKDLAAKNTSEPKVLAELKRQMVLKELFTQLTGSIVVSDAEVRTAFDQRSAEFGTPERREIHNIVVATKPEADATLAEVNAPGANFEAIAGQRTLDTSNKANGGNLGVVSARDLDPAYAGPAFAAQPGVVFGPLETQGQGPDGKPTTMYNIGKVVQVQPAVPANFDQVKDTVKQTLFREKADAQWRSFLSERVKDADVKYADAYRPADPDSLPSTGGGPAPPR